MAKVKFTRHLIRFFPTLQDNQQTAGKTVAEVLATLNDQYPGISSYIVNENGQLRKHVNIFVNGELIRDRDALTDAVADDEVIYFFQALSGG